MRHLNITFCLLLALTGCRNAALDRARAATQLDRDGACELARDYYREVQGIPESEAQLTCAGTLNGGEGAAQLTGYTFGRSKPTLCLVRAHRWMVLRELGLNETCEPLTTPPTGRLTAQALRAAELGIRSREEARLEKLRQQAELQQKSGALDQLVARLVKREHRESVCDVVDPDSFGEGVAWADLDTLNGAPPQAPQPWWFLTHPGAQGVLEALPGRARALVISAAPGGKQWPAQRPEGGALPGRFRGWAMLVNLATGAVECETELQLEQTGPLVTLAPAARAALLAEDDAQAEAELRAAFFASLGTRRTEKNIQRDARAATDIVERLSAAQKDHAELALAESGVYQWDLARDFDAKLKRTLRYLTDGRLKPRAQR